MKISNNQIGHSSFFFVNKNRYREYIIVSEREGIVFERDDKNFDEDL